ncbi:unnamed protein product [Urochloa humidicola]
MEQEEHPSHSTKLRGLVFHGLRGRLLVFCQRHDTGRHRRQHWRFLLQSSSELPPSLDWDPRAWDIDLSVTDGRDGKLRIFAVFNGTMKMFVRLEGGEWALEKKVLLLEATRGLPGYKPSFFSDSQYILRVDEGYAILSQYTEEPLFSINLETMEVALSAESMKQMVYGCKLPWPPALHACLDR